MSTAKVANISNLAGSKTITTDDLIERHRQELALGLEPTEELMPILEYIQHLRDIPQQDEFPYDVNWGEEV